MMIIRADGDVAKGMLHRVGGGSPSRGLFAAERVDTKDNAADFGAKMLDLEAMSTCMNKLNMKWRSVAGFRVDGAWSAS